MIIPCPCGEKKFEIDESLIPEKGRNLQCGSCNRKWFYKKPIKEELVEEVNPKIDLNEVEDTTEHEVEETKNEIGENDQIEKEKKFSLSILKNEWSSLYLRMHVVLETL